MDIWVLVIGGVALMWVAGLAVLAEYYTRHPDAAHEARRAEALHRTRIKAWERAELERVGPEIFYGNTAQSVRPVIAPHETKAATAPTPQP